MRSAKRGRNLGLAILAMAGVMVVGATGAHGQLPAESTPGIYLVNLASALLAEITVEQVGPGYLLVPDKDLKIECESLNTEEGEINTSADASLKIALQGCLSFSLSTGKHLANCVLKTLGTIALQALVLPIAHAEESFLLLEPIPPSTALATVSYKSGTGCTLSLDNSITGSISALVGALDAVTQLGILSEGIQLLTGDKLSFEGSTAYLDANIEIKLSGGHAGDKLGIHEEQLLPSASIPGTFSVELGSALLATFTGKQEGSVSLLFPSRDLLIECTALQLEEGKINSSTDAQGKLKFSGCLTFSFSTEEHLEGCVFKPGALIAQVLILAILHSGEKYVLFEPRPGSPPFLIAYKAGLGCPLALSNVINGSLTALVKELTAVTQSVLFSEDFQLLTQDYLTFGLNPGYLDAQLELALSGEHADQKLGIH
jgi:hypothetical protein